MNDLKDVLKDNLEFYQKREKEIISILASLPKGSLRKKIINGDQYYYLRYRKEGKVTDEYIGKKVPENLLKLLEMRKNLESELKKVRDNIKILKGKNYTIYEFTEPVKNLFKFFTKEKLWDEEIEIIGSWCYILYQNYLAVKKYPLRTEDIDILIPFPYRGREFDLSKLLKDLGFSINFYNDGSLFFTGFGLRIEFLSPERGKNSENPAFIERLKITPQMLRYLDILLMKSLIIGIGRGIKVRIPAPSAFFIHKLLVSDKRREIGKKEKDLRQAVYVGEYILRNKDELINLTELLSKFPDTWKKKIKNSLENSIALLPEEEPVIRRLFKLIG